MSYTTLQLALSEKTPEHVKIKKYLDGLKNKRHGYRSNLLEKALLMYIDHQEMRGEDAPKLWTPIKGEDRRSIVLTPPQNIQDPG
ncbi:MAG: hypothetical protein GY710_26480 [Desulfobacteraceae bacterium]|nr:hypothetical protein [Desulfobacteraceae bacterium]